MNVLDQLMRWREALRYNKILGDILGLDARLQELRYRHSTISKLDISHMPNTSFALELQEIEREGKALSEQRKLLVSLIISLEGSKVMSAPRLGERMLLLILTKEERINIPGDLEEEFKEIAAKHGERFAKLWYYKQVLFSAGPMIRKALKWGIWAWVGEWVRRLI